MSGFTLSALRRAVRDGDWLTLHGDTILRTLFAFRFNAFNPDEIAYKTKDLTAATGLGARDLAEVLGPLGKRQLIEYAGGGGLGAHDPLREGIRITDAGVEFVATTPWMLRQLGAYDREDDS